MISKQRTNTVMALFFGGIAVVALTPVAWVGVAMMVLSAIVLTA